MNSKQISEQLAAMKGGIFTYGTNLHCVVDYTVNNDAKQCTIVTNRQKFNKPFEAMRDFLTYWEPAVPEVEEMQTGKTEIIRRMQTKNSRFDDLMGTLTTSIELVKKDGKYVKQADAINKLATTIINATKLELDFHMKMLSQSIPRA